MSRSETESGSESGRAEMGQDAICGPWAAAWAERMTEMGAEELVKRALERGKIPRACLPDEVLEVIGEG